MDRSSLSPDDIAYRRALLSAKEKHEEGGTDPFIHQQSLSSVSSEGGNREGLSSGNIMRTKEENDRLTMKKNEGKERTEVEEEGGGENIGDKSDKNININNSGIMNQSSNIESNTRELSEGREEVGGGGGMESSSGDNDSIPLGTGGGGGASSGSMQTTQQDINRRMMEMESIERHPLPKLRDSHHQPKAIASTFQPPSHLPPSTASGYRFHAVNEHMRSGGGKAPRSQKMIMQPGGKYGQRY